MNLICNNISYSIKDKTILHNVSIDVKGNKFYSILGPNGCGKTTLLKTIYRILKPSFGKILLNNKNMEDIRLKDSAKEMAVVAQFNEINFDCNVEDMVMLGRTPHIGFMQTEKQIDYDIVKDALRKVGMLDKSDRSYLSLSGGEKQRVALARAIAQRPSLLLLDEPTNHLDIKYKIEILQIIKDLNINVLAVLHNIQLACKYSDYIYLMKGGEIKYEGNPKSTITKESMKDVYDIDCKISWADDNQALIEYI
jgi:ferric enterobactin transport ATP-binding protein fepC